jgi:hypothetical protein
VSWQYVRAFREIAACRRLEELRWLRLEPVADKRGRSLWPVPLVPVECQLVLAKELEQAYGMASPRGEFLMRCHLTAWVRSRRYFDNARPIILTNPKTGGRFEYDRLYVDEKVAFEFNGPQHYSATDEFPDEEAAKDMQARDAMKAGLSLKAGVMLVVVEPEDLRDGAIRKLLPPNLALNRVDTEGPYYQTLLRLCEAYVAKIERESGGTRGRRSAEGPRGW